MLLIKSKSMYSSLIWSWRYSASLYLQLSDKEFKKWCQQGSVLLVWRLRSLFGVIQPSWSCSLAYAQLRNGLVARCSFGLFSRRLQVQVTFSLFITVMVTLAHSQPCRLIFFFHHYAGPYICPFGLKSNSMYAPFLVADFHRPLNLRNRLICQQL